MEQKRNFSKELERIIKEMQQQNTFGKSLLLHSCCAPCSSSVMEYLRQYFRITVFYYNPNISMEAEYQKRVAEQKRLIDAYNKQLEKGFLIDCMEGDYKQSVFYEAVKGLEQCPEGGERCFVCYELRLCETAKLAAEKGFDWFATTLTVSPLKNAAKLNEIGERLAQKYEIRWLPSDFKKMDINVRLSCLRNMICTGKIIVAVFFPASKQPIVESIT